MIGLTSFCLTSNQNQHRQTKGSLHLQEIMEESHKLEYCTPSGKLHPVYSPSGKLPSVSTPSGHNDPMRTQGLRKMSYPVDSRYSVER